MNINIEALTQVINDWDPVGLLAGGAPENEYSIEVREIAQKSTSCKSETDLAIFIYRVFNDKMGVKLNQLVCLKQAFKIIEYGK
ncbi:hypothetical protein HZF08_38785 [Paenibacillus sp. CGMCC 1.16610]|uniref:DUF1871 family protein n=1 Tax=Paenibacillus anseongense TaxID=2682845 RepID=A0ABW9UD72_9BACL|nr:MULTISPECIES: hypothetical protein [Paenibacillus]MBA2944227.1 hypothetical protein [Paenibacillus sp. CGMCC 1.16610]MVQ38117.1 hypothetical protein [Paenibacillus anseongense]